MKKLFTLLILLVAGFANVAAYTTPSTLYLVGTPCNWDPGDAIAMEKNGDVFSLELNMSGDNYFSFFSQKNGSYWPADSYRYSVPVSGSDYTITLGTGASFTNGQNTDKSFKLAGADGGKYRIEVNFSTTKVTVTKVSAVTYTTPSNLYILGNIQNWKPSNGSCALTKNGDVFTFTGTFPDSGDGYSYFSFAETLGSNDDDWTAVQYGASSNNYVIADGDTENLTKNTNAFKIAPGQYNFTVTFSTNQITLQVEAAGEIVVPEPELYLLGNLNTWTASDTYKFTKNDVSGKYELNSIAVPAETNFKIYDKTSNTWYGGTTDGNSYWITDAGNQDVDLNTSGKNFYFKVAGTWSFVVDLDESKLSVNGTWPAHTTAYYLAGDFTNPTWKAGKIAFEAGTGAYEGKLVVADKTLEANKQFKVLAIETNLSNAYETDTWYGASGDDDPFVLTEANSANVITMTSADSKNFQISEAGTWTFVYVPANNTIQLVGEWPHDTFTIYGEEDLTGANWDATAAANDMETSNYVNYTKTIEGKTLYAGKVYKYKVAVNHDANTSYPDGFGNNATLSVTESGVYNITFSYNASTHAIDAEAVKQSAVNDYVKLQGSKVLFGGDNDWKENVDMITTDGTTYTYTIPNIVLAAQDYGYKAIVNEAWDAEGYVINNTLTISTAATYNVTITFNNSTKELTAVATPVVSWTVAGGLYDANAEAGQEFNHDAPGFVGSNWDATNTDNNLTETSAGSGVWTKTYTGVPAGTYAFKVAYSHTLATAYPAANYEFTLTDASNVTVYYHETGNYVTIKVGDAWYDKWTVVGTLANVNGETEWAATETANDMTSTDGVNFVLSVTGKTLYKGSATYSYKVVRNHAYGETYPSENASLPTVSESGVYTINYTFNAATKAVNAELVKTGVAYDYVDLQGAEALFGGTAWSTMFRMSTTDGTTYTYTIEDKVLAAQDYGYKAIVNNTWTDGYVFPSTSSTNTLTISTAATYNVTITFNNSTKELTAVATPVVSWTVAGCLNDGENEVDATGFFGTKWAATATDNDLTETSAGSGVWTKTYTGVPAGNYEFKVAYSHTWDAASYPSQNIKLNIPAADATVVINFYDSDHTFSVTVNGEEKIARWVIAGGVSGDGTNAGFFNTAWNASDFTNKLTETSPGVWSKTYSDVPAGTYEFKVVESGTVWYGVPPSHDNYSVTVPDGGATLQFIWNGTTCTIENTATTWTIVGGPKESAADLDDVLFTKTWDPTQTANDLEQTSTGYWTKTFSNVHLPVGIYEFKVAKNHAWDESYPTGTTNESFEVKLEGDYDVTFEFYTSNKDLYGDITLKAADVDFYLAGTTFGWGTHNATNKFSIDNGLFVLEDVDLEMGAEFKLWDGADLWIGAQSDGNYWLNNTNKDNITMLSGDGENIYLAAAAGTYTVTFNPNTFKLSVAGTFGEPVKTLAFGATGYLTFGDLRNSFSFDGKGVDVYTVTYDADGMARRHAVESKQVPVGTGVLLYHTGGAGEVEIPIIGTPDALTDNNLHVSDGTVEGATNRYCLAADSTPLGVGFYPVAASVTIPAGKAYLQISNSSNAPARIWFDGETTAIDSLNGETGVENDGTVYDLNGRRVNGTLSRGLYIKNGKKFIVK